ncbi:MAG: hypothetical protein WA960_05770 [Tunicatimonas sp.]
MKTLLMLLTLLPVLATAQDQDFFLDQEYEVSPSGTIDLTCDGAEVRITGSNRATARVVVKRVITDDDYTQLTLPPGNAQVEIQVDDGHVMLRAL